MFALPFNRVTLGLALAGFAGLSHAAGFALIEQNASGLGNAYAAAPPPWPRTPARSISTLRA